MTGSSSYDLRCPRHHFSLLCNDGVSLDVDNATLAECTCRPEMRMQDTFHDWPEDAHLENGNYVNSCCKCKQRFIGHKRRVVCKACHQKAETLREAQKTKVLEGLRLMAEKVHEMNAEELSELDQWLIELYRNVANRRQKRIEQLELIIKEQLGVYPPAEQ